MIGYLEEWLRMKENAAPVYVGFVGETKGLRRLMRFVDSVGVVLADPDAPGKGIAYPWSAIFSIAPNHDAS